MAAPVSLPPLGDMAEHLRHHVMPDQPALPGLEPPERIDPLTELAVSAAYALASRHWADDQARLLRWPGPIEQDPMPRWLPGNAIGLVRARIAGARLWERDPAGTPMVSVPILPSVFDAPEDIAVFHPGAPATAWFLRDSATAQNEAEILVGEGPLVLFPDLYAWARGRGQGAVIFDLAAWAPVLIGLGRDIHCVGLDLAAAVDKALKRHRPRLPKIGVLQPATSRAA